MNRINLYISLLICTIFLSIPHLYSQNYKPADFGIKSKKALKLYLEGLQQAQWRARDQAIALFKEAVEIEPNFAHAHYHLGVNAYVKKQYEEALTHLEKSYAIKPDAFRGIEFFLGESYFYNARYSAAIPLLEKFVQEGRGRKVDMINAGKSLRHARYAAKAINEPVQFEPLNLGENINSERDEYLPYLTADGQYLLFTSRRPESVGGFNRSLQDYSEDFYFSTKENEGWSAAQNLGRPINTPENEGAASITQDGSIIFFTACNLPDGQGSCDIYYSVREGNAWSKPNNLGDAINSESWDSQPCLSDDGKTLYFASARQGGMGGRDIWYSELKNGRWTEAKNLGAPINTVGNEDSPFLHADGVSLYFSSDFHPGFGSQDLFVCYRQRENGWTEPTNLGYPLNTVAEESNIFVAANGKYGYINSDRKGGLGKSDLYEFELDERIRPRLATFLRGIVVDSLSEQPVYAQIQLIDVETSDTIRQIRSNKVDGRFLMSLPLEREYAAYVQAPGYLFESKNFYLKNLPEETYFDLIIELKKIKKETRVVLPNIFFETGKWELKENSTVELTFLYNFLKQNPRMKVEIQGHTDDIGSEADNLLLSQRRADAVRDYLIQKGIDEGQIVAKGYGESMPVAGNITDEDRAQNRRTEVKILETGE